MTPDHRPSDSPEQAARRLIDVQLAACGWAVQSKTSANLSAQQGVAEEELSFKTGEPDYTPSVDGKAIGMVEAKPAGHSLVSVEEQSAKYTEGVPAGLPVWHDPLPFFYESTGDETRFTNRLDPDPTAARFLHFIDRKPVRLAAAGEAPGPKASRTPIAGD